MKYFSLLPADPDDSSLITTAEGERRKIILRRASVLIGRHSSFFVAFNILISLELTAFLVGAW